MGARSFAGYGATFLAADAISAGRLGRRSVDLDRTAMDRADLRTFATSGLPFSADQGARTAVQFSTRFDSDRHGALSVLAVPWPPSVQVAVLALPLSPLESFDPDSASSL